MLLGESLVAQSRLGTRSVQPPCLIETALYKVAKEFDKLGCYLPQLLAIGKPACLHVCCTCGIASCTAAVASLQPARMWYNHTAVLIGKVADAALAYAVNGGRHKLLPAWQEMSSGRLASHRFSYIWSSC